MLNRTPAYKFLQLPYNTQARIARELKLMSDEDLKAKNDTDLFILWFKRAIKQDKFDMLIKAIDAATKARDENYE